MMSSEKRASGASYIKSEAQPIAEDQPSDVLDEDNAQLSLDPKVQTYLSQVSQESGCWGRCFPIPFERAARRSWWDPTFDSEILEDQYKKSANSPNTFKFRSVLLNFCVFVWEC